MKKADMALILEAPAKGDKPSPEAGPKKAKGGDTLERGYFQQAIDAFRNGDDEAAITSAIQGIRACIDKDEAAGY